MKISNETKIGAMAAIAIVILILGFNFLKGNELFTSEIKLSARYNNIDGLNKGNPVLLYGLAVGRVDDLELLNEPNRKIKVIFHINEDVKLPTNSVAKIISSDILGSKALELMPGNSKLFVKTKDTIAGDIELSLSSSISKVVAPVKDKIETLLGSVDTVVNGFNEILNEDTKRDLKASFHSINRTVRNIEKVSGQVDSFAVNETGRIRSILLDVQSITSNFKSNSTAINRAIENFGAISDSLRASNLKQTIKEADLAMRQVNEIITKINSGKGTLGLLINDDKMYNNLETASKDLDGLIQDLKANPKRYVHFSIFGGRDKKPAKASAK